MTLLPGQDGLRLDQAPPLAIPARFFATVPVALAAVGGVLLVHGGAALSSRWLPATVALTHLLTLGVAAMAMIGALYQMIPVVAGVPVPRIGLAKAVHALLCTGLAALVSGLLHPQAQWLFHAAEWSLGAALLGFVVPTVLALWRAPTKSPTVAGMRLAMAALIALITAGLVLAWQYATGIYTPHRVPLLTLHALLGGVGWVGVLIAAVSWQVLPMFYLAHAPPPRRQSQFLGVVAASLGGATVAALLTLGGVDLGPLPPQHWIAALAGPAVVAIWLVAPLGVLRALQQRKRPRKDASLQFWYGSQAAALATALCGALALVVDDDRALLAAGWLAAVGWAAGTIHGMLTRIVPFLVWFHRFSHLVGLQPVLPMNRLWPDRWARLGFWSHAALLALGLVAIGMQYDLLVRLAGAAAVLTALSLAAGLYKVLAARPVTAPAPATANP
ncbi:MAG: hypothetical protein HY902_08575 [Deltaproteobacteria bacterium]|nr:hypothetical protein [Deltaproteobacteria bacterium]